MRCLTFLLLMLLSVPAIVCADGPETDVKPISVTKVYGDGRHNMNTAFARWRDRYWLAFRTGMKHSGQDGATLVLASDDGQKFEKMHGIDGPLDERDVQFVATPERLFLYVPIIERSPQAGVVCNMVVTTTTDGATWTAQQPVYEPKFCLWRPFLHEGKFWATAYRPGPYGSRVLDLVRSNDGWKWEKVATMREGHAETETTLQFVAGGKLLAFHRDASKVLTGFLMTSEPPYTVWSEPQPLPTALNGQSAYTFEGVHYLLTRTIRQEGEELKLGTMIYTFDDAGRINPYCKLPSSGDCAYPNALQVGNEMWVSYHSSHEGAANIYLARVPLKTP